VSEYEPQYWGFETCEEWDSASAELAKEYDKERYTSIMKYVRGEPNEISPGTFEMEKAEIARTLVERDASLLLRNNKQKLLKEIDAIYKQVHADDVPF
jgi:hypothetical protein